MGYNRRIELGELSSLIDTLSPSIKLDISKELGIPTNENTDGQLLSKIILIAKEFRNDTAHNKVIFDGRYKELKNELLLVHFLETLHQLII